MTVSISTSGRQHETDRVVGPMTECSIKCVAIHAVCRTYLWIAIRADAVLITLNT